MSTVYYAEAKAVNRNDISTAYAALGSTSTLGPPTGFGGNALGISSIAWSWNDVSYEDSYKVIASTDQSVLASRPAGAVSWAEPGLSTNTSYSRQVAAYYGANAATAAAVGVYTLAAPPTGFMITEVYFSSADVSWQANNNPPWTVYETAYWTLGSSTSTLTVTVTSAALTSLAGGTTIYMSVRAKNNDGYYTAYDVTRSTMIPAAIETVAPGQEKTIVFNGPSGPITVEVPQGAFATTVVITVKAPDPASVPAETGGLKKLGTPVVAEITLDQNIQPAKDSFVTTSYKQEDLGAADENRLVIARHDPIRGVWVPLFSTRDTVNNKVTALTDHFSLFQVMEAGPSGDFSGVTVGPVPWMAGQNPGTPITFRNLPSGAKVRIYTLLGELVYEALENGTGMAVWKGKNKAGRNAASGVYVVLLSQGSSTKKLKVVIER